MHVFHWYCILALREDQSYLCFIRKIRIQKIIGTKYVNFIHFLLSRLADGVLCDWNLGISPVFIYSSLVQSKLKRFYLNELWAEVYDCFWSWQSVLLGLYNLFLHFKIGTIKAFLSFLVPPSCLFLMWRFKASVEAYYVLHDW